MMSNVVHLAPRQDYGGKIWIERALRGDVPEFDEDGEVLWEPIHVDGCDIPPVLRSRIVEWSMRRFDPIVWCGLGAPKGVKIVARRRALLDLALTTARADVSHDLTEANARKLRDVLNCPNEGDPLASVALIGIGQDGGIFGRFLNFVGKEIPT